MVIGEPAEEIFGFFCALAVHMGVHAHRACGISHAGLHGCKISNAASHFAECFLDFFDELIGRVRVNLFHIDLDVGIARFTR